MNVVNFNSTGASPTKLHPGDVVRIGVSVGARALAAYVDELADVGLSLRYVTDLQGVGVYRVVRLAHRGSRAADRLMTRGAAFKAAVHSARLFLGAQDRPHKGLPLFYKRMSASLEQYIRVSGLTSSQAWDEIEAAARKQGLIHEISPSAHRRFGNVAPDPLGDWARIQRMVSAFARSRGEKYIPNSAIPMGHGLWSYYVRSDKYARGVRRTVSHKTLEAVYVKSHANRARRARRARGRG